MRARKGFLILATACLLASCAPELDFDAIDLGPSTIESLLPGSWEVEKTAVSICLTGLPRIGAAYDGCALGEILDDAVSHGVSMGKLRKARPQSELIASASRFHDDYINRAKTMTVSSLDFHKDSTFTVHFLDCEPMSGKWVYDNEKEYMEVTLSVPSGSGNETELETTAGVRFDLYGRCDITADASFTSNGKPYEAFADLILVRRAFADANSTHIKNGYLK